MITGVSYRQMRSKDEPRGWFGNNAGFSTKLGGTIALAFANRRNRPIIRINDFALRQRFALGEAPRLVLDQLVGLEGAASWVVKRACWRVEDTLRPATRTGQTA